MKNFMVILCLCTMVVITGCAQQLDSVARKTDVSALRSQAVDIVRAGLSDPGALVRSHAVEVVSTAQVNELIPAVFKLFKDQSPAVRFGAAVAVGDLKHYPAQIALVELLRDENENVRIAAAYSLACLGKKDNINLIRRALSSDDQTVRANAVLLLGKLGDKKNLDLLYSAMRSPDSADKVKLQAVESIALLGDERIYRGKLWALLISKHADDRVMGIRGMGALKTVDAKNAIITMLYDEVPEVRLCAAEQLGRLGDTVGRVEVLDYLKKISDSDVPTLGTGLAVMAIGRIGTEDLAKYLPRFLAAQAPVIRLSAAQSVLLLSR